ncbi:MAG: DinB family protein [Dehalococcoidia bacterium]
MTLTQATLLSSHEVAHMLFNLVTADLTNDVAERTIPGACISRISPILAHAIFGEDMTVNLTLRGGTTILEREGWAGRTGIPGPLAAMTTDWLGAAFEPDQLRAYAAAVFAGTEQYLEDLPPGDLERMVTSPLGSQVTGAELLSSFNLVHLMMHTGEIAALKGVQGVPGGLPF